MGSWDSTAYVTVEVSSAPPDDPNPVWVDITPYVLTVERASPMTVDQGRQTELSGTDPTRATVTLNNADGRFLSGWGGSPYYPWWKQGRKMRIRETVGYQTFDEVTGYLQLPETRVGVPVNADNLVTVSIVDRLARLDVGRKFVSTLAEYIMFNGGTSLKAYYPLNETGTTLYRDALGNFQPLGLVGSNSSLASQATAPATYGQGQGVNPPGDDVGGLKLTPSTVPFGNINAMALGYWLVTLTPGGAVGSPDHPLIHAGDAVTFLAWVNLDPTYQDAQNILSLQITDASTLNVTSAVLFRHSLINTDSNPGYWEAGLFNIGSGLTGSAVGPYDIGGNARLVGIQFSYSPNTLKLWINQYEFIATPTGTLTDPEHFTLSNLIGTLGGSVSHAQFYIGPYSRAQFLAQYAAGYTGLSGQYTGDRIRTIAQYAGIPATLLSNVDDGVAMMTKASLAGQSPTDQMRLAETTEQGRLRMDGRGQLIFDDRIARYNL